MDQLDQADPMGDAPHFRIGTRGSDLARWQAHYVRDLIESRGGTCDIQILSTQGDREQVQAFEKLEGKGFFTKEIEQALLDHSVDLAVHSHKDLETRQPDGLTIAAVPVRAAAQDVLLIRREAPTRPGLGFPSAWVPPSAHPPFAAGTNSSCFGRISRFRLCVAMCPPALTACAKAATTPSYSPPPGSTASSWTCPTSSASIWIRVISCRPLPKAHWPSKCAKGIRSWTGFADSATQRPPPTSSPNAPSFAPWKAAVSCPSEHTSDPRRPPGLSPDPGRSPPHCGPRLRFRTGRIAESAQDTAHSHHTRTERRTSCTGWQPPQGTPSSSGQVECPDRHRCGFGADVACPRLAHEPWCGANRSGVDARPSRPAHRSSRTGHSRVHPIRLEVPRPPSSEMATPNRAWAAFSDTASTGSVSPFPTAPCPSAGGKPDRTPGLSFIAWAAY